MVTKNEALIITAAVALAFVPRFEAQVQQFAQSHRTEIQMAMNELQGKPAIPFAETTSVPEAVPAVEEGSTKLASLQENVPPVEFVREHAMRRLQMAEARRTSAEVSAMSPVLRRFTRVPMAELAPQLAKLKFLSNRNNRMVQVYRSNITKCSRTPEAPATPAIPTPASFTVEISPLP